MMSTRTFWVFSLLVMVGVGPGYGGSISGRVKVDAKKIPAVKPVKMETDPDCVAKHKEPLLSERFVVDEDKNVMNAFVYIKSGLDGKTFETPRRPVQLDQVGCSYTPRVLGIMVGQPLLVLNSDRIMHNVHMTPQSNTELNKAMPGRVRKLPIPGEMFSQPEIMIPFKCDVHPWMAAYVGVLPHPFFAVSAEDGTFEIQDVPPGKYELEVWHEFFKGQIREIEVGTEAMTVDLALAVPRK